MDSRFSPIELIKSGKWHSALFGTYALSLGFFEAVLLPALRQAGVRSFEVLADIDGVAGALGEAGAREVGRTYDLHPIIVKGGIFHPKFMLLDGVDGPSLVIGSGNLTFGGWGYNLELCEVLRPDTSGGALLGMADFLDELCRSARVTGIDAGRLGIWTDRLRAVAPSGSTRIIHNISKAISEQLVDRASKFGRAMRLTVVSPYFGTAAAVDELASLLSVAEVEVHVHDAERLAANGHHFPFSSSPTSSPVSLTAFTSEDDGPLHAKLIEIECELGTLLTTGSVNASVPALTEPRNVELAVVRVVDTVQPREPANVPLPIPALVQELHAGLSFGILRATLLGTLLKGSVLTSADSGNWHAEFDHDGVTHDLGMIYVGEDGAFEAVVALVNASYGRRRSTLVLRRRGEQVRGFVSFPDAIELNNRWGTAVGPMIRIAGGSDDDDDLAGVLEYFASNPAETASPWQTPKTKRAPQDRAGHLISLSELAIREAKEKDEHGYVDDASRGAFTRILAALRIRLTASSMESQGATSEYADMEDDHDYDRGNKRVLLAFDAIIEVLEMRIPADPAVELARISDIAGFVLLRRPEPMRINNFARWWSNQATSHLAANEMTDDIRATAAGMILLDGFASASAERARGKLARVFGNVADGLDAIAAIGTKSRLRRLFEIVSGADALEMFAADVRRASSVVEEVVIAAQYVSRGLQPPPLPMLDDTDEMRTARQQIRTGNLAKILPAKRGDTACPRCHISLPSADYFKLQSVGIARARNCCSYVLMVGIG